MQYQTLFFVPTEDPGFLTCVEYDTVLCVANTHRVEKKGPLLNVESWTFKAAKGYSKSALHKLGDLVYCSLNGKYAMQIEVGELDVILTGSMGTLDKLIADESAENPGIDQWQEAESLSMS